VNNPNLPYHFDSTFGDPMPPLPDSNPNVIIAKDIVRSLLTCIDNMQSDDIEADRLVDFAMAIREAREWLGEEPECKNGVCHL